jgi:hypothetical protein
LEVEVVKERVAAKGSKITRQHKLKGGSLIWIERAWIWLHVQPRYCADHCRYEAVVTVSDLSQLRYRVIHQIIGGRQLAINHKSAVALVVDFSGHSASEWSYVDVCPKWSHNCEIAVEKRKERWIPRQEWLIEGNEAINVYP